MRCDPQLHSHPYFFDPRRVTNPRNLQQDPCFTDPEKTWVSNSSIATYWTGSVGIRYHSIFDGTKPPPTIWGPQGCWISLVPLQPEVAPKEAETPSFQPLEKCGGWNGDPQSPCQRMRMSKGHLQSPWKRIVFRFHETILRIQVVKLQLFLGFSPLILGKWSNLTIIFFKGVGSTTN